MTDMKARNLNLRCNCTNPFLPVVQARAVAEGVLCFLNKPFDASSLLGYVRLALQRTEPGKNGS
jgi:hypothetical protein